MRYAHHRRYQLLHLREQHCGHHGIFLAENHGYEAMSDNGDVFRSFPFQSRYQVLGGGSYRPGIHSNRSPVGDIGDSLIETTECLVAHPGHLLRKEFIAIIAKSCWTLELRQKTRGLSLLGSSRLYYSIFVNDEGNGPLKLQQDKTYRCEDYCCAQKEACQS